MLIDQTDHLARATLRQYEVFLAIAQTGTARAAADQLARSQSAISSALAELESALGQPLFDRTGKRLKLNAHGRALVAPARALIERAADIEAMFAQDSAVSLHVAASFTVGEYLLPERLAQWVRRYPRRPVQMSVDNTRDVVEAVAALQADIGFVEGPVAHRDVLVRPWLDDELVLVARAGHPLAGSSVELAALRSAAWALREPGSGTRQVAESWLRRRLESIHVALELGSTEAIKRALLASDLLSALSRYAVQREIDHGTLVSLHSRLGPQRRALSIVSHRARPDRGAIADFIAHCRGEAPRPASV
ncbi:LysR family transcriptional regulator [Ottowia sp. GY511]|uniref:LysR substrate-binding domain-containing protein n=1 Tax=Ottowia flava TaxID=2675430 RepID=A0ABW4KXB8_9BURK|nr:LysR substrate-binding domain-containing protein [Ottowia sp. GY511]TXK33471.1 LysR family transcriptional regulator [Ottowia sp. GY511]